MDLHLFKNIGYLKTGNEKQKRVYQLLTDNDILNILKPYDPILTGTIPICIDIEGSDLDIICCVKNFEVFRKALADNFGSYNSFSIHEIKPNDIGSIVANFSIDGFEVEIFGQNVPTTDQWAYRHMLAEYKILLEKGEAFRQEIIRLKQTGMKTEPAFGLLLGMENPYEELLQ